MENSYKLLNNNRQKVNIALIGSPNIGKSTYFNRITWKISNVGNIDKITTSICVGKLKNNKDIVINDLPGIYKLDNASEDEKITLDYLIRDNAIDEIVNVVSVDTLYRDMDLVIDLLETGIVRQIVVNMIDEDISFKNIDDFKIFHKLKTPISFVSAKKNLNINSSITKLNNQDTIKPFSIKYNLKIEKYIESVLPFIHTGKLSKRFIVIQYLCGNQYIINHLKECKIFDQLENQKKIQKINSNDIEDILKIKSDIRKEILGVLFDKKTNKVFTQNKFDKILFNKYFSVFFFCIILAAIFYLTFGEYAGGWIQLMFAEKALGGLQDLIKNQMLSVGATLWATSLVVDGIFGGIFTLIGFVPWIFFLTLFITILEQIGYLARVSVSFDKTFERFGLSGRSIINLITGVGCNVPSILMAKNLHSHKEKMVSIFISPLISCSARIVVFGWLGNVIVSQAYNWLFVLALVIISGFVSLVFGMCFSKLAFRKQTTFFMTEIPKWRTPDINTLFKKIFLEIYEFLKRVLLVIFIVTIVVWFLTYTGPIVGNLNLTDTENGLVIDPTNQQHSWIYYISEYFRYLFIPAGIGNDWRIVASLLSAFPAKEIAASNIELLFNGANGFRDFIDSNQNSAGILTSFIIFLSFYTPCMSTVITMKKEAGKRIVYLHLVSAFLFTYLLSMIGYMFVNFFTITITSSTMFSTEIISLFSMQLFFIFSIVLALLIRYFYVKAKNKQLVLMNNYIKISSYVFITIIVILMFVTNILMSL
ncbi:MAG: ferrous iron transport protein B [Malacoplasma sp.]